MERFTKSLVNVMVYPLRITEFSGNFLQMPHFRIFLFDHSAPSFNQ